MKPNMARFVLSGSAAFLVLAAAAAWLLSGSISPPEAGGEAAVCRAAPEIGNFRATVPPAAVAGEAFLEGGTTARTVADYRGKGLVMNFWATWCAPCLREMPALDRLQSMVGQDGIVVVAVSEDRGDSELVERFYRENRIHNLAVVMDQGRRMLQGLRIEGLPTTVLIDRGGREVGRVVGILEWDSPAAVALVRGCLADRARGGTAAADGGRRPAG